MGIFESRCERLDQPHGAVLTLVISGNLDETTNLPELELKDVKKLVLNVGQIEGVNSIGIRSWIDWMGGVVRPTLEIEFVDAQPSFVFQFNMVVGFFPKNAAIRSLYVPVYCEKCDVQKKTHFSFESAVKSANPSNIPRERLIRGHCKDEACEMEPDYQLKQYLAFLAR